MMSEIIQMDDIQNRIFTFRGMQVMVDRDLAEMYDVEVKRLNEQVKRNVERFPAEFRFQLSDNETTELVANCDRFKNLKHSSINPHAFTEQGVAMLSAVLRSSTAIKVSIQIMQAFVKMKTFISSNAGIFQRIDKLEEQQSIANKKFNQIFKALESNEIRPKQNIFFDGQVFDAYSLIADIIRSAKTSIIIIDNYVDDTVFKQLTKRAPNVEAIIYTKQTNMLKQDIEKHNAQYPKIELKKLNTAHDRFLIIDRKTVYHFGASLKDAGKKWFACSILNMDAHDILEKLN
jgi:3-dehydroquinate dehydratase